MKLINGLALGTLILICSTNIYIAINNYYLDKINLSDDFYLQGIDGFTSDYKYKYPQKITIAFARELSPEKIINKTSKIIIFQVQRDSFHDNW